MFFQNRVVNPVVGRLLRSSLHRMLSGRVALITVTGRKTGNTYRFPVMYVRAEDVLYVLVGQHDRKTWWRNVRRPAPVRLLIAGHRLDGTAAVLEGSEANAAKKAYLARFPRAATAVTQDTPVVRISPCSKSPDKHLATAESRPPGTASQRFRDLPRSTSRNRAHGRHGRSTP
ncbi:nitroreductase family deazaflavin-dependent oxidoreductase [Actinomadura sp. WMMA1423]|uniref:nitroreductase family deazaflavin-dependent oxidoreductase n=1 Tax=Actinomadura sp. WMMA1423 TaxID=2591108 RepID=UPI0011473ECE|nr:nitroreductase family deazaflavin-dependent oxidoreductase [Actinomadura sp. WMMA1423]